MISLQFENLDDLMFELNQKYTGLEEMVTSKSKTELAKAIFTITTKKFIKDFSVVSMGEKKKYFHMYEWNKVGNPAKKLYSVNRESVSGGNLRIHMSYLKSTTPVPIAPELLSPGKTQKFVTKRSIFKDMAEVMETGKPVTFTTRQAIVFMSNGEPHFLPPNKTIINKFPGGKNTTLSFEKFVTKWYATKVDSAIMSSGLYSQIGKGVARTLNEKKAGPAQVRETIRLIAQKYSQGVIKL